MRTIRAAFLRLAGLFGRSRRDRDLEAELESHLQLHIDDNLRGLTPAEARRQALLKLAAPIKQRKRTAIGADFPSWTSS